MRTVGMHMLPPGRATAPGCRRFLRFRHDGPLARRTRRRVLGAELIRQRSIRERCTVHRDHEREGGPWHRRAHDGGVRSSTQRVEQARSMSTSTRPDAGSGSWSRTHGRTQTATSRSKSTAGGSPGRPIAARGGPGWSPGDAGPIGLPDPIRTKETPAIALLRLRAGEGRAAGRVRRHRAAARRSAPRGTSAPRP